MNLLKKKISNLFYDNNNDDQHKSITIWPSMKQRSYDLVYFHRLLLWHKTLLAIPFQTLRTPALIDAPHTFMDALNRPSEFRHPKRSTKRGNVETHVTRSGPGWSHPFSMQRKRRSTRVAQIPNFTNHNAQRQGTPIRKLKNVRNSTRLRCFWAHL